jgi:asparagine synthase (glutamine-hydrolysing)
MPGISFRYNISNTSTKINDDHHHLTLQALNSTIYNHHYKRKILLKDQPYLLACTKYSEYPIKTFEDMGTDYWICIEGKIYGKEDSVIKNELVDLLNPIFSCSNNSTLAREKDKLLNWLLKTDGEFVICVLNKKTRDFIILNDVLGRLPLYYYYSDDLGLLISRELQFIAYLTENEATDDKFDRMAIAQYLLFGYPLHNRTLLRNVHRVQPASLIRIHNNKNMQGEKQYKIDILYCFNFDDKKYRNKDIKKNAAELISLFSEACKNRAYLNIKDKKKNIISLSGGLDSRCVTAAFNNNKIPCSAVTYTAPGWTPVLGNDSEGEIAKQLANMFGIEWEKYGLIEPKSKDLLNLLTIKQGATYLGYSFILPFLEELKERHDGLDVTFFTGEGRETVLPNYVNKKTRRFRDSNDLISHIINRRGSFSIGDIADITQIKESEIIGELKDIVSSYPEKDLNRKYVHFVIYENAFKGIFEVEDKDRYYFWSVSPFYSVPFFDYVMKCERTALYREFFLLLSPSAAAVDKADYGAPVTSYKYRIILFILTLTYRYPLIKKIIRRITNKRKNNYYDSNSKVIKCLQDQIRNCKFVCGYLSCSKLQSVLDNSVNYNRRGIDLLFTITSLIEKTYCNKSALSKYYG